MVLSEAELQDALLKARQQGLPPEWSVSLDDNGRKRWSCGNKSFAYLQRALDYINGGKTATAKKKDTKTASKKSKKRGSETSTSSKKKSKKNPPKSPAKEIVSAPKKTYAVNVNPETSLDVPNDHADNPYKYHRQIGTVAWDPNSKEGKMVGYRLRVFDFELNKWKTGRIIRYDPITHEHKCVFFTKLVNDEYPEEWLYLPKENIQLGGEFVWALVKGFAWWPAQQLHCLYGSNKSMPKSKEKKKDLTMQPTREGYQLVEFFASDEVASVKVSPETLRDFNGGEIDSVIAKNKKKRNLKAIDDCKQEENATIETRNDAARFYAEKAFQCVNAVKADGLLGRKIEVFRDDINYPTGEYLLGTVRAYSQSTKKHLVAYHPPPYNSNQYEPRWENLSTQRYKIVEDGMQVAKKRASKKSEVEPDDFDLFPFLFGYEEDYDSSRKEENKSPLGTKCRGCVGECDLQKDAGNILQCSKCRGYHHAGCLDPPLTPRAVEAIRKSDEPWTCSRCIPCMGCRELDIAFGTKAVTSPPGSLYLHRNTTLLLCNACEPMYEKEMFCPCCAHIWDDTRYQYVRKQMKKNGDEKNMAISDDIENAENDNKTIERGAIDTDMEIDVKESDEGEEIGNDNSFRWKSPQEIPNHYYYPENNVWGYNEATMLGCEKCGLWVHSGCAEMTKLEYEKTTNGNHPVYSREYLCRKCCKEKCLKLLEMLRNQDTMYLFAEPVTDQIAHNYSDVIKNPMDLRTMSERALIGNYRNYAWLRESFELMVYNALLFNPNLSQYWKEAKRYYNVCKQKIFLKEGKGAPESKYEQMIQERFENAEKMIQAEKDRVKADKTAEKKDLVAGDQVLKVELGDLVQPKDPPSCVPTNIVQMSAEDAFYSSWMECCFSCGSSGASDTMLFCVDCGEAYHSFCASAPIHCMNEAAIAGWRCANCKICEISGEVTTDELKMLYCEMCDRAFQIDLISPALDKVPEGLWICGQCVDCKECKNTMGGDCVSRAFWSRSPDLCFSCGGCDGLEIKSIENSKCTVCKKWSRDTKNLSQCGSCHSFIHPECDVNYMDSQKTDGTNYACPKCRKKAERKMKKKEEAARRKEEKEKEKKSELESGTKSKYGKASAIKRYVPSKNLTVEEQKQEALQVALKDAQSRGLPEGWTCFYGAGNRKRWRSPAPIGRVFDSVPKALQFVEKVKNGYFHDQARMKEVRKEGGKTLCNFCYFKINLDLEPEWLGRETGYDDNTSLMSDAEVLLKILEKKIDYDFAVIFDVETSLYKKTPHVQILPKWLLARAGRFVRFVKRLRQRAARNSKQRGIMNNQCAQIVVCKMASAFLYSVCTMFHIDYKNHISSWKNVEDLLIPNDGVTGTLSLWEEPSHAESHCYQTDGQFEAMDYQEFEYKSNSTHDQEYPTFSYESKPSNEIQYTSPQKNDYYWNETMAQIPYHQFEPIDNDKGIDHVPLYLPETGESLQASLREEQHEAKAEMKPRLEEESSHAFIEKSESEFNIADALMTLASPTRIRQSTSQYNPFEEMQKEVNGVTIASEVQSGGGNTAYSVSSRPSIDGRQKGTEIIDNSTMHTSDTASAPSGVGNTTRYEAENINSISRVPNNTMDEEKKQEFVELNNTSKPDLLESLEDTNPVDAIDNGRVSISQIPTSEVITKTDSNSFAENLVSTSLNEVIGTDQSTKFIDIKRKTSNRKENVILPWFNSKFIKAKPLCGWDSHDESNSHEKAWFDSRTCCLCNIPGDDDAGCGDTSKTNGNFQGCGRLLPIPGGGWIHTGCALWSSETWETAGGVLNGVSKARARGVKLRCFGCGQQGATLGCFRSVCNANFHYPCAKASGVVFTDSHKLFCSNHTQFAKDELIQDFEEPMKVLRIVENDIDTDQELSIRSGSLVIHSLGTIVQDEDGFHSQDYITPLGFASTRIFWSFVKPKTRTVYMMRIIRSENNKPLFIAVAADAPDAIFQHQSVTKVYQDIMTRVWGINNQFFSRGDLTSVYPMMRSEKNRGGFCLNGPQFFGFGVNFVREALETHPGAVSCAVPLTEKSVVYKFCIRNPTEESVMDLQRKRAAMRAEKALENTSGCARTEGSSAFDKSKGSGRITRALVQSKDEEVSSNSGSILAKGVDVAKNVNTSSPESIQAKYDEMKSVPMEDRLEAKRSHIHGWGLFAKKDYPKNSMIAEYMGEGISQPIADRREKMYDELGMGSCYMFRLDLHEIVDATNIGCMARFMNHCCAANAYANVIQVTTDLGVQKKIVVFANQDIKTGDEITYDYKFPVEDGSLRCTCGAPNCIGRMN